MTTCVCVALLAAGWSIREERYITPEEGLGYQLGVAGAGAMFLILLYSARKRLPSMATWGLLPNWFRWHMVLGVVGPILVLFHSNFQLGSTNSSVALFSTLLVAGSGLVGRFMYLKVHYGLYGRRAQANELLSALTQAEGKARPLLEVFPEVLEPLAAFESRHTTPPSSALTATWRLLTSGLRVGRLRRRCMGYLDPVLYEERAATRLYIERLRGIVRFTAWERLFRLWHAIHVPLFVMLIATATIHVLAVHMY